MSTFDVVIAPIPAPEFTADLISSSISNHSGDSIVGASKIDYQFTLEDTSSYQGQKNTNYSLKSKFDISKDASSIFSAAGSKLDMSTTGGDEGDFSNPGPFVFGPRMTASFIMDTAVSELDEWSTEDNGGSAVFNPLVAQKNIAAANGAYVLEQDINGKWGPNALITIKLVIRDAGGAVLYNLSDRYNLKGGGLWDSQLTMTVSNVA